MNMIAVCPGCGSKNRIPPDKQHLTGRCGRCGSALTGAPVSGRVNSLTDAGFPQQVEQCPLPVLVDFYSPTCGPCRSLAPVIEAVAARHAGRLMVFTIDTSREQRQAARFHIRGVPTLLVFRDGQLVDQLVGAAPQEEIERLIGRVL